MRKRQTWFGVKTLYRQEASGKPRTRDRHYDPAVTLVEERVVLFRARSHAEAIRKAEREASRYAASFRERNVYGQRLRNRFLGALDSFELFENPTSGEEVFSTTFLARGNVSDQRLINRRVIVPVKPNEELKRRNFFPFGVDLSAGA